MTWAETSSPAEVDLHPPAPPLQGESSEGFCDRPEARAPDLEAEIGSWTEAPVDLSDDAGFPAMGERAQALGYLWVDLAAPGPEYRGRLGLYIEESLETRLEQLGAPPAGIHASTSLDASLSDQLYRARFVERRGLALGIPNLEGIANLGRTLDADDSSVLRWWIAATADRPVRLVVSTKNQFLRVYPSPVLFESLFDVAPEPVSPRAPSVSLAESARAMDLSDLPPSVEEEPVPAAEAVVAPLVSTSDVESTTNVLGTRVAPIFDISLPGLDRALGLAPEEPVSAESELPLVVDPEASGPSFDEVLEMERAREALTLAPPADPPEESQVFAQSAEPAREPEAQSRASRPPFEAGPVSVESVSSSGAPESSLDPPGIDAEEFLRVLEADSSPPPAAVPLPEPAPELASPTPLPEKKLRRPFLRMAEPESAPELEQTVEQVVEQVAVEAAPAPQPREIEPAAERTEAASAPSAPRAGSLDASDPFNQLAQKEWRTWRDALAQAAGPRPLAAIERMFVTDYTRLAEATRRGIADETAKSVLCEWQTSFQKSYAETFDALRVRGKRPTMVLDLPDIAQRLGRLQGARRVQLLLIDGLRFDLGLMVQERLRAKVDAALTERLLLWSALPSTTTYQLELLGKGPEGLLERFDAEESPALVARGRAARAPRRIRTGRIEVQKIDVVEDALRTLGRPMLERFDEIAAETADAIAEHMAAQPPRTLVVVFGDHGFRLDPARVGTTEEVRQGGSSPEEVLVPAFAWLTGAVH